MLIVRWWFTLRQWASRKTRVTPTSATAASEMANQKIGELGDAKKLHYESKLAMKQLQYDLVIQDLQRSALLRQQQHNLLLAEHTLRMNVLNISRHTTVPNCVNCLLSSSSQL